MHEKANRAAAAYRSVRQNAPVCGDNCYTPGNEFAALLQCALDGVFNAAAAGDLHARHGHTLDIVFTQDGGELFRVVALIQLGASDERYAAADEILVKRTVGVRGAVRRDEQSCALKIRRVHRSKLDLDRPLGQRAGGTGDGAVRGAASRRMLRAPLPGHPQGCGAAFCALAAMTAAWS